MVWKAIRTWMWRRFVLFWEDIQEAPLRKVAAWLVLLLAALGIGVFIVTLWPLVLLMVAGVLTAFAICVACALVSWAWEEVRR